MITPGVRYTDPVAYWVDVLRHLILPATTLALGLIAGNALIMRSSMIETLRDDYITTARAKGLTESQIVRRHAIPNALLPTVTVVALTFGYVLGGAIGVEEVFAWPGMGTPHRRGHPGQGLPGAPGPVPGHRGVRRRGQPARRHHLRAARPAGAHVTAAAATPALRAGRRHGVRSAALAIIRRHRQGTIGLVVLPGLHAHRGRRPVHRGSHRQAGHVQAAPATVAGAPTSAPTAPAATCS